MITNVNFDDEAVGVISRMADETVSLIGVLADLQSELSSLIECINYFATGLNEGIRTAFATTASEGLNVKGMIDILGEGLACLANIATILDSKALVPLVATISGALAPAISSLCSYLSMVALTAQVSLFQTNLLTGGLALLKVALMVLGDVMKAHPLLTAASILIAVGAAAVALWDYMNKGTEQFQAFNARMEEAKKKTDELNASMKESETAYKGSTEKIEAQAGAAEKLAEKVFALAEAGNKSTKEKQQASLILVLKLKLRFYCFLKWNSFLKHLNKKLYITKNTSVIGEAQFLFNI